MAYLKRKIVLLPLLPVGEVWSADEQNEYIRRTTQEANEHTSHRHYSSEEEENSEWHAVANGNGCIGNPPRGN